MSKVETIILQSDPQEALEILGLLKRMSRIEKMNILTFLRGVEFGKMLAGGQAPQC